jgi:hypothetical protein
MERGVNTPVALPKVPLVMSPLKIVQVHAVEQVVDLRAKLKVGVLPRTMGF